MTDFRIGRARAGFGAALLCALWAAPAGAATTINVATASDLQAAINTVNANPAQDYAIVFANNITLTGATPLASLNTTSHITINGAGFTLDGGSFQRGFSATSGTIAISNLTIQHAASQGGPGGAAVEIGSAAAVTLGNVKLLNNTALGGSVGPGQGGAILVAQGGTLSFTGGLVISGNNVMGNAQSAGSGMFLRGSGILDVAPGAGISETISDAIVDSANNGGNETDNWGLAVHGGGALTLASTANNFTGAVSIADGATLIVTGSIEFASGVHVNTGGTLAGTGTSAAVTVASGGTVAPGNGGVGTLTVRGSFTAQPGATYAVDVSHSTADEIVVTGTASLGGTLSVTSSSTPVAGAHLTVLTASSGVSGTFTLANAPSLGIVPTLSYDANDVFLNFTQVLLTPHLASAASGNAAQVVAGVDRAIVAGDALPAEFQALGPLAAGDLAAEASQLTGEAGAALPGMGRGQLQPFLTTLMTQSGDIDTDLDAPGAARVSSFGNPSGTLAAPRHAMLSSGPGAASVWLSAFGGHGDIDGNAVLGTHDTRDDTTGIAGGIDILLSRGFTSGLALSAGHTRFALASSLGKGTLNAYQAGFHTTKRFGALYLTIAGAYALDDFRTLRTVTGPGAGTLAGKVRADNYAGRFETGYRLPFAGIGLTPYLAFQASAFHTPAYTEIAATGSSVFALHFVDHTATQTRVEIGAGLDGAAAVSRYATLHLFGRVAYAHDSGNASATPVAFQALPGSDFTVQAAAPGANSALLSLGAELRGVNGLSLGAKFDGALSQHSTAYFGTLDLRYSW